MQQDDRLKAMARAGFDALLAAAGRDGRQLVALAEMAKAIGLHDRIGSIATEATACAPGDGEVGARARRLLRKDIPAYHINMLRDARRNESFEAAINRAVSADSRVIDIGAGSGLLSMMAARAGARKVVACEMKAAVADVAREIVALNGYADRVRIVTGKSTDLDLDLDFGGQADVIVSEILSNDLLGEGVLSSLSDAAARLLALGGRMIPAGGDIMIALAEYSNLSERTIGEVAGFDLSPFNRVTRRPLSLGVGAEGLHLRSAAMPLFIFDFTVTKAPENDRTTTLLIAGGGPVNGIVQWIRLKMDDEAIYENSPAPSAASHWGLNFYPLAEPRDLPAGTRIDVHGRHDGASFTLWTE